MNIRSMLLYLINLGFTEQAIAKFICTSQSTVSRILSGRIQDPKGSLVNGIRLLFERERMRSRFLGNSLDWDKEYGN